MPRAQVEMISIAQQNLRVDVFQNILRNSFYRSRCSHRHKHWRFDHAMRVPHGRAPSRAVCGVDRESKRHACLIVWGAEADLYTIRHNGHSGYIYAAVAFLPMNEFVINLDEEFEILSKAPIVEAVIDIRAMPADRPDEKALRSFLE